MEATHDFGSSLLTKINEVKPLIEDAGRLNLDLIAIPEAYFRGRGLLVDSQDLSESIVLDSMKVFANKNNINVIFQVVENEGDNSYNTAVVIDRDGIYLGKYRKVNLPPEESTLIPGDEYIVFDMDFGKVGILICWDGWFTEPSRILAEKGAELIVIPTWCNIERNLKTITAENGVPVGYAVLRINCGADDEDLPSSVYDHYGDLISVDHPVGQNKVAISTVTLGGYKNLAIGKTVDASNTNDENPVANLVDGIYSTERDAPAEKQTAWFANSLPQWIEVDLGAEYDIERLSLAMFDPEGYDFSIEGKSDEGEYVVLSESVQKYETFLEHGIAGSEITTARFDTSISQNIRYVRLNISSSTKIEITINEIKVFGYTDPGLTAIDDSRTGRIPSESKMLQNYPNPFNPETNIQYMLKESSEVNLTVYTMSGQVVRELVNKHMPAGEHMVIWNGKNQYSQEVSSGIYVAKLDMETRTGNLITDSTKLILVR
jgi:predicted amidohydrolase